MLTRVVRALVSAQAASFCARLNHPFDDQLIRARPTRCDRSGRDTHIGAIEIEANALDQQRNHLLAQARICAWRADLGAIVTSLDTLDEGVVNAAADMRMRGDHLLSMHAVSPCSAELHGQHTALPIVSTALLQRFTEHPGFPWASHLADIGAGIWQSTPAVSKSKTL
jgi:hypothetical protein